LVAFTLSCGGSNQTPRPGAEPDEGQPRTAVKEARDSETINHDAVETEHTDAEVRNFVAAMVNNATAEVELGGLAAERGSDAEVKQFGRDMARDHARSGADLKQIADRLTIALPAQLDDKHRAITERLVTLRGSSFDREYMSAMVDAHQHVLSSLEEQGAMRRGKTGGGGRVEGAKPAASTDTATNGEQVLSEWAARTLPVVQAHLERAREIDERVNGAGRR